jgi:hypothetical protein
MLKDISSLLGINIHGLHSAINEADEQLGGLIIPCTFEGWLRHFEEKPLLHASS